MKNRRLCAIVLLAALTLLQVRVAFAACLNEERITGQPAVGCCLEHALAEGPAQMMDEAGVACAPQCVKSSTSANDSDVRMLTGSKLALPPPAPLFRSKLYPPSDPSLQLAAADAVHPPHTSLIYVLQRLLI
jgi:hypothetical protein